MPTQQEKKKKKTLRHGKMYATKEGLVEIFRYCEIEVRSSGSFKAHMVQNRGHIRKIPS